MERHANVENVKQTWNKDSTLERVGIVSMGMEV